MKTSLWNETEWISYYLLEGYTNAATIRMSAIHSLATTYLATMNAAAVSNNAH